MEEDPVLDRIGNWGKWQATKVAAFGLVGFFFGWQMLSMNLLLPEQDFWCLNEDCSCPSEPTDPPSGLQPLWLRETATAGNTSKSSNEPRTNRTECPTSINSGEVAKTANGENSESWCARWDYDRSDWPETVVSQFNLVCDRDYLRSMSQSLYMAGIMIGSFVSGLLSDRFGRKRITLLAAIGLLISGLATALSPSMPVFILLRCIVAFFSMSVFNCGFCYCMEIVGGRAATIVGIGLEIPWSFAYMLLPLVSWIFPRWQHLEVAISLPVLLLVTLLLIPGLTTESPRWLLARGRVEEAALILDTAASTNGRKGTSKVGLTQPTGSSKSGNVFDLFKTVGLLRSTLIMYYLFFTNSFVYYGLTLNSGSLIPGNLHFNIIVSGLLEIAANVITIFALLFLGRRLSVCGSMAIGGVTLFAVPFVDSVAGKAALAQIGRFAITGSFSMVFVYAVEIFPTVIRNVGLGSASVWARVGGIIAPYIGRELGKTSPDAPLYIFGATSLIAAGLVLFLPETKGVSPPSTVEEGERFNREEGGLNMCKTNRKVHPGQPTKLSVINSATNDSAL